MRIGLRGSVSSSRLSNISQTWSGRGGGPNAWPRGYARGGMGSSGGAMAPTSWTKLSVVTRTPRYSYSQDQSPGQLSTAEIFSGAYLVSTPDGRRVSPQSPTVGMSASMDKGNGLPVDEQRWAGDVPFREESRPGARYTTLTEIPRGESKIDLDHSEPIASPFIHNAGSASDSSQVELSEAHRDEHSSASTRDSFGSNLSDSEYDLVCQSEDRQCIFAPKTICVISRFPIYGVLRRFLRHLYAISLSRSGVPLERYISMFVSCIPMPPPGRSTMMSTTPTILLCYQNFPRDYILLEGWVCLLLNVIEMRFSNNTYKPLKG